MPEESRVFAAIGRLEEQISALDRRFDALEERTTREQRKVHDIVVATSEAVRNITRTVDEMKPLTEDYREKRAEARGAARMAGWLYTAASVVGGVVVLAAKQIIDWITARPHIPVLVILVLLALTTAALAHSWYPAYCCHDEDCRPVPCEDIAETPDGFMYDGVKFAKSAEKPSEDRRCHVCIYGKGSTRTGLCIFTLQGT